MGLVSPCEACWESEVSYPLRLGLLSEPDPPPPIGFASWGGIGPSRGGVGVDLGAAMRDHIAHGRSAARSGKSESSEAQ